MCCGLQSQPFEEVSMAKHFYFPNIMSEISIRLHSDVFKYTKFYLKV